ncbi:hypothetical protein LMG18090_02566 [Ralstonia mannitolilytica]|nr:hypothetical protein LMG18090_02566 [Ralstonia mannitolilytica]
MKCDRRSAVHQTERPRYAPAVRTIRLLARFRRPKVARSKYCSCEWNDGEHAGQARGGPARGMRMMPETPGMCTRPGAAHVPAADSVSAAPAAYPFLRKHDATPHASRCAYPFLRGNSQKWVRSEGRFYTLGIGLGRTRFCEPTRSSTVPVSAVRRRFAAQAPNPFLRSGLPLRRTRFCGAARRNGYAGAAGERRKPLANKAFYPQKQVRRFARTGQDRSAARPIVGSFSDESCEDGAAAPYSAMLHRPCAASHVRRNGYADVPSNSIEACTRSSANRKSMRPPKSPVRSSPQIWVRTQVAPHHRTTQKQVRTGLPDTAAAAPMDAFHAETGTLAQERRPRTAGEGRFLWITLWTTQCCPRRFRYGRCAEAGTVSRRSGYAVTQNRVRRSAESSTVLPHKPRRGKALRVPYTVYL